MSLTDSLFSRGSRLILERELTVRSPLYHPDFPVIMMWSEKSACTVAVKWFFHHVGLLDEALSRARWVHVYENEVFKARKGYLADCKKAILSGKPVIKFVRNPYLRVVSGFLETCNPRVLREPEHWSTIARSAVLTELFNTRVELEYAYSFNQFVRWLAAQPPERLDLHLAPQFRPFEAQLNVEVVRLEDSANAFCEVEQRFGLPSTLGNEQIHASGHHHRKRGVTAGKATLLMDAGIPIQRRKTFRLFDFPVQAIAEAPAGEVIRGVYAQDFSAYDYEQVVQNRP